MSLAGALGLTYREEGTLVMGKVRQAFKHLRTKEGMIARCGFSCCGSCAGSAMAAEVVLWGPERQAALKGVVFFTRQDREAFWALCMKRYSLAPHRPLYLAFGQLHVNGRELGLPTVEVGGKVRDVLEAQGLSVEWDGTAEQKLKVLGLGDGVETEFRLNGLPESIKKSREKGVV